MKLICLVVLLYGSIYATGLDSVNLALKFKTRLLNLESNHTPIYQTPTWHTLLHYNKNRSAIQKDSSFFLSNRGYKDPKLEYITTIEGIFTTYANKEDSVICAYPARVRFIASILDDREFDRFIDNAHCQALQEFLTIVPIDEVFIEFAAESDVYPGSSMGHIFLHLSGYMRKDFVKQIDEHTVLNLKKGDRQDYSISYFATLSPIFNPLDYIRAIYGNLNGNYALEPYGNTYFEYIENEKRSIYRFKFHSQNIELFRLHLWELKDKSIDYAFITHNCTNAIEEIVRIIDSDYTNTSFKPFITPAEYLQGLKARNAVSLQEVFVPTSKQEFVKVYGYNDVLKTRKSSKLSLGYENSQQGFIYFAPIYSDMKNADSSYYEFMESRLASIELRMQDNKGFVSKVELIHLYSVLDFVRTRNLSKLLSFKLESNIYNHAQGRVFTDDFNSQTRLFPTLDMGLGFGVYIGNIALYAIPSLGYRYEIIHNPYVSLKSGFIMRFKKVKILGDYSVYYDMVGNNRGYDSNLRIFSGINIYKQIDIFVEGNMYHILFDTHSFMYQKPASLMFRGGVSVNF